MAALVSLQLFFALSWMKLQLHFRNFNFRKISEFKITSVAFDAAQINFLERNFEGFVMTSTVNVLC